MSKQKYLNSEYTIISPILIFFVPIFLYSTPFSTFERQNRLRKICYAPSSFLEEKWLGLERYGCSWTVCRGRQLQVRRMEECKQVCQAYYEVRTLTFSLRLERARRGWPCCHRSCPVSVSF